MKFYVSFVMCCFILPNVMCLTEEMKQMAIALHNTCVGKTGVDEAVIAKVNAEKVLPDEEKLKCYLKCIMTETGVMDDEGTVDIEAVKAMMPDEHKEKAVPIVTKCGTKVGANHCENAWLTHQCYLENAPNDYMLI